jgi:hypothetical protein
MLIRVVSHFMQRTVYRKKKNIQVQSTIVPLTELTWQRLDYMRYSKLKKIYARRCHVSSFNGTIVD